MASPFLPRQDIPEIKKDETWYKGHTDYAEKCILNRSHHVVHMSALFDSYNGNTEADSIKTLVSTYGKKNRSKYVSYKLSKTKLDILVGEFLKMPLNATVKSVNATAISEKMAKYHMALGAMHAKEPLDKLKSVGVDVMEGAQIPD